jgi:hypothetical protein
MGSLDKRPSLIPQSSGYKGLGRNPESKIREAKEYKGVGKSPETLLREQVRDIDRRLAEEAKQRGEDPRDMGDMTLDQKLEALRDAKPAASEKQSEELSARPSAPPAEQPSVAPSKQQFAITTDVIEEKPERPELVDDTTVVVEPTASSSRPPFFPTLLIEVVAGVPQVKLRMVTGFIHTQKNVEDAMVDLEVVGIPVDGEEVVVTDNTKCWVVADEDAYGTITNPTFATGLDWPESVAPILIGGDNDTGEVGLRHWRLCEITVVEEPLSATAKIHRTGIIEHFIPRRVENANNAVSIDEGRFFKEYLDEDYGTYQMRVAKGLRGLHIEEGLDGDADYLKLLMPVGTEGAVLHFINASEDDPELGEWVELPAPDTSPDDGFEWVLRNVVGGPPEWIQIQKLPAGALNDMLVHDGAKWITFAAPAGAGTFIHAYQGGHVWLETEECDSPPP